MGLLQDEIFSAGEGDHWFSRNRSSLNPSADDRIVSSCKQYKITPSSILEVGAANGYRLEEFRRLGAARCVGLDPSQQALADGKARFPKLELHEGQASDLGLFEDQAFDLVICSFVFHWIDRRLLLSAVAEIDRVLRPGGFLVIADFDPDGFQKTRYHHRADVELYTYKQSYREIFAASGIYSLVAHNTFDHSSPGWSIATEAKDRAGLSILQKDLTARYTICEIKR